MVAGAAWSDLIRIMDHRWNGTSKAVFRCSSKVAFGAGDFVRTAMSGDDAVTAM